MNPRGKNKELTAYYKERKRLVDQHLASIFKASKKTSTQKLDAALTHTLLLSGKRIRPILAIATYELFGNDINEIIGPACAIELIHTGSLMLDDLPSMDNATYRRGKKTNHVLFGESTTILASAGLWVKAFDYLAVINHVKINNLVHETARFIGDQGLILGQYLDLFMLQKMTTIQELEYSYELKTSALFRLAVRYGSYLGKASAEDSELLDAYARHLGIAFQIRDDIIDATQTLVESGKDAQKDVVNHKANYVSLVGLDGAKTEYSLHLTLAKQKLEMVNANTSLLADIMDSLEKL